MRKSVRTFLFAVLFVILCAGSALADPFQDVYVDKAGPGATGWLQSGSNWVYLNDGRSVKGWGEIGSFWYWFDDLGNMVTGSRNVNGVDYYFTEESTGSFPKGSCQNPYGETITPATDPQGNAAGTVQAAEGEVPVNPYGHTCVEVNLTGQFIRVWQGNDLVITGPCVTGYKGVHDTSAGNYVINSKETDRYLQGYNDNGTKYKSYVNFWMPFNGGQGLHDAGWRGTSHENYGGEIYTWNGSHGCVNLPYDVAAALYNIAYVGMPVHTHY